MACPFFVPSRRLDLSGWVRPPRYPLGDLFGGTCHACPDDVIEPPEAQDRRELCNCGYARGRCDRFPTDGVPDAVRFSVTVDAPTRLSVVYVLEKDHAPVEFGTLEYAVGDARLDGPAVGEVLVEQARAFLKSYLNRREGNRFGNRTTIPSTGS